MNKKRFAKNMKRKKLKQTRNSRPALWNVPIPKHKIIFFTNEREENEVLLWEPPSPNTIKSVEPKFEKVA